MKPIIAVQDKTPSETRAFRLKTPLLARFDAYCAQMKSQASYTLTQILTTWLDEVDRMQRSQSK